ncbi:hypothetical protein HZA42_02980 [Candidatus Peregrinibacteria bacterium]|nr:hypothetical protein [Candidatus Peregrinibacteria bacterium]
MLKVKIKFIGLIVTISGKRINVGSYAFSFEKDLMIFVKTLIIKAGSMLHFSFMSGLLDRGIMLLV